MTEEIANTICQSRLVVESTKPMTIGPAMPPKLPIMFMLPETVPAYLPPMSVHDAQLPGIVRSLQKLARPMAKIVSTGFLM